MNNNRIATTMLPHDHAAVSRSESFRKTPRLEQRDIAIMTRRAQYHLTNTAFRQELPTSPILPELQERFSILRSPSMRTRARVPDLERQNSTSSDSTLASAASSSSSHTMVTTPLAILEETESPLDRYGAALRDLGIHDAHFHEKQMKGTPKLGGLAPNLEEKENEGAKKKGAILRESQHYILHDLIEKMQQEQQERREAAAAAAAHPHAHLRRSHSTREGWWRSKGDRPLEISHPQLVSTTCTVSTVPLASTAPTSEKHEDSSLQRPLKRITNVVRKITLRRRGTDGKGGSKGAKEPLGGEEAEGQRNPQEHAGIVHIEQKAHWEEAEHKEDQHAEKARRDETPPSPSTQTRVVAKELELPKSCGKRGPQGNADNDDDDVAAPPLTPKNPLRKLHPMHSSANLAEAARRPSRAEPSKEEASFGKGAAGAESRDFLTVPGTETSRQRRSLSSSDGMALNERGRIRYRGSSIYNLYFNEEMMPEEDSVGVFLGNAEKLSRNSAFSFEDEEDYYYDSEEGEEDEYFTTIRLMEKLTQHVGDHGYMQERNGRGYSVSSQGSQRGALEAGYAGVNGVLMSSPAAGRYGRKRSSNAPLNVVVEQRLDEAMRELEQSL
ncbi:uncharacterized protein VTP21DRAFT_11000 [Calcarisporiella thermophila]|uniref:uncharacterized protein n=1 Tax=Calcarisporiella thermophila TaxID=911321 RepID=UPI0037435F42